jgi:TonB family protein
MSIISRFLNVFRPKALERELDDEVRFHLGERSASNIRRGMTQPEAESTAREQFGEIARVKHEMREVRMVSRRVVGAFALGAALVGLTVALITHSGLTMSVRPSAPASPGALAEAPEFYRHGQDGIISPVVLREVKPKYTAEAMHAKVTGTVIIECIVQPNGGCEDVHVTTPLDPGLDRVAVNALQAWRFQPGLRMGKPVPVLVTVDMSFSLR